ncbi:MAG: LamG domain-containing protein [Patescibacteria group bacterium]
MKRISFAIAAIIFLWLMAPANAIVVNSSPAKSLTNGLVGWWTFDGMDTTASTANAKNGLGNNGTRMGTTSLVRGKIGQAIKLDGLSGQINAGSASGFGSTESHTFSAWINAKALGADADWPCIISRDNTGVGTDLLIYNQKISFLYNGGAAAVFGNSPLSLNKWYFISVVYDASTNKATFYVNGLLDVTSNALGSWNSGSAPLYIGSYQGSTHFFNGSIDDARIYSRALSATEIQQLYKQGGGVINKTDLIKAQLRTGLVGQWTFDGLSVTSTGVLDQSGLGNNGGRQGGTSLVRGKIGQAMKFDGTNDFIDVGHSNTSLDLEDRLTLSTWVKFNVLTGTFEEMIVKSGGYYWIGITQDGADYKPYFLIYNGTNRTVTGVTSIKTGVWYHIVGTWDKNEGTMRLYLNGIFENSLPNITTSIFAQTANVYLGGDVTVRINGLIDDARIYNRALSATEIQELYKMGGGVINKTDLIKAQLRTGLVGQWTFDGLSVTSTGVLDQSGQNNNGGRQGGTSLMRGKIGQAMKFDGVDGKVSATGYETTIFTISAWVKTNDARDDKHFVEFTDSSGYRHGIGLYPAGRPVMTYGVAKWKNSTGSLINDSKWHHFVGTYDGISAKIYIDGISQGLSGENSCGASAASVLVIGRAVDNGSQVNSLIDDARVYSRALSAQEVYQLYKMGK